MKSNNIKIVEELYGGKSKNVMLKQLKLYYKSLDYTPTHNYKVGDEVKLKKGTLLHGTFKNYDGLKQIKESGLLASSICKSRVSKYPGGVSVWNLKRNYKLKEYIDFYSGGTLKCSSFDNKKVTTEVIPYSKMNKIITKIHKSKTYRWYIEQTKEARFLPSLVQDEVQIGIIFDSDNIYIDKLKKNDILSLNISNKTVEPFVNENFYSSFIKLRKEKDDFFTDRESAILFGIPGNFVIGIIVGKKYEANDKMLNKIKKLYPNAYICNLDGIVIRK